MEDQDTRRSSGSEALMQACFSLICPGQHPRPTESAWSPLQWTAQGGDCGCHVFRNTVCCCCCSVAKSCPTPCDPMDGSTPGSSVLHCLLSSLKPTSSASVMPSNRPTLCCPVLLLPSILPRIRVFSNESALCIRGPKY